MPSKRYALFSPLYRPHTGGVESFTEHLAHALRAQDDHVLIVTMRIDGSPEHEADPMGVEVLRLPCHALMGGRLPVPVHNAHYKELFARALDWNADRVLVNTRFYGHSIDGLRYADRLSVPAIVLDHGSAYLTLGNAAADTVLKAYERYMTMRCKRFEPKFAGISLRSAQWLGTFGIHTETVISNAIEARAFRAAASHADFRTRLGVAPDGHLVLFVGRLEPEKGCEQLVGAARLLSDRGVQFALAGEGSLRSAIEAAGLSNVHLLGNVAHDDLAALMLQSDCFCLPTRSEGFCTSLLEAGACGLPAVITDVGGARELIPDASYGTIIPSADEHTVAGALVHVLNLSKAQRSAMGERCRERVEQCFNWLSTVHALENAFVNGSTRKCR